MEKAFGQNKDPVGHHKTFTENIDIDNLEKSRYACDMYWFTKE